VQKWEERRKRSVIREYWKDLKDVNSGTSPIAGTSKDVNTQGKKKRPSAMQMARQEMERQREEKQRRHEQIEQQKAEREEALKQYRIKKAERFKRLSKKTKKGQPVMKDRLELLLEKVQKQCKADNN
jgi:hypothetical protein